MKEMTLTFTVDLTVVSKNESEIEQILRDLVAGSLAEIIQSAYKKTFDDAHVSNVKVFPMEQEHGE